MDISRQISARPTDLSGFSGGDTSPNGRTPALARWVPPRERVLSVGWWPVSHVATAVLLIVTLASAHLAFGPPRFAARDERPPGFPVALATPATPSATEDTALVAVTLPAGAFPDEVYGGLSTYTIPPQSSGRWDPVKFGPTCCTGPRLNYVIEGSYIVRGDGSARVLRRGANGPWEEIPAGQEITLETGDALISQMDDPFDAMNPNQAPAVILERVLFAGDIGTDPIPTERSGRPAWRFHDQDILFNPVAVPVGPVTLRVRQVGLQAGANIPLPLDAILQWAVSLESDVLATTQQDFTIHNFEQRPLDLYMLTVEPVAENGGEPGAGSPTP
jgi:hypothetical protein